MARYLYDRQIRVHTAGLVISEPRITLDLTQQVSETQDRGEVNLYNLNPAHASRIAESEPITIEAGYPSTIGQIFRGVIQKVDQPREHLAHITRLAVGELLKAPERLGGYSCRSYGRDALVRDIVRDIVSDMGLEVGPLDAIPAAATYPNVHYVISGPSDAGLYWLLRDFDCTYYEDAGVVRINRIGGAAQADAPTIRITPRTGLIGIPTKTDEGAKLRMFLNPRITLGSLVNLESQALTGRFKTTYLRQRADNWASQSFRTELEMRAA